MLCGYREISANHGGAHGNGHGAIFQSRKHGIPFQKSTVCAQFLPKRKLSAWLLLESRLRNIIGGVFCSVAKRIAALACKKKGQCGALVGGGGKFDALKVALESELGRETPNT